MNAAAPSNSGVALSAFGTEVFSSEDRILETLVTVRNSPLPSEEKSAIRDLILDYVGSKENSRRAELKTEILRKLEIYKEQLAPIPVRRQAEGATAKTAQVSVKLGRVRPEPIFSVAKTDPAPAPVTPEVPKPIEVPSAKPAEETKKSVPAAMENTAPESAVKGTANPKARIDEIKHDVNTRVGNPINLINADEEAGKEYMAALLDAMKKSSAGELPAREALARLEAAYRQVLEVISKTDVTKRTAEKTPQTAPVRERPLIQTDTAASIKAPTKPPATVAQIPKPAVEKPSLLSKLKHPLGEKNPAASNLNNTVAPITTLISKPGVRKVSVDSAAKAPDSIPVPPKKEESPTVLRPLSATTAETALPEKIAELRQKAEASEQAAKKPITDINNEKVTVGLQQLLAEWTLFKGKGWFGSGASGMNSPLYKQLSSLSMAAVVAGRFEGATPEVKQSLTDYMNGWRYEQGIVHEMGESFEHYLRRVILHILERQHDPLKPEKK